MINTRPIVRLSEAVTYNRFFYYVQAERANASAHAVVPLIQEILKPKSVVDVGCGVGHWVAAFHEHGVERYLGIDGPWVARSYRAIPEANFLEHDLTVPLEISDTFDLVVSLEVAEHLPERYARSFVKLLTSLGDVVMFSAAVPEQGGRHHVNEQWQSYWAHLFSANGYAAVDCVRPRIWNDKRVQVWYRQNIILYVREEHLFSTDSLAEAHASTHPDMLSIVHPDLFTSTHLRHLSTWTRPLDGINIREAVQKAYKAPRNHNTTS